MSSIKRVKLLLPIGNFNFVEIECFRIIRTNNTSQAYPAVHRGDAQTGGLLLPRGGHAI